MSTYAFSGVLVICGNAELEAKGLTGKVAYGRFNPFALDASRPHAVERSSA